MASQFSKRAIHIETVSENHVGESMSIGAGY